MLWWLLSVEVNHYLTGVLSNACIDSTEIYPLNLTRIIPA